MKDKCIVLLSFFFVFYKLSLILIKLLCSPFAVFALKLSKVTESGCEECELVMMVSVVIVRSRFLCIVFVEVLISSC